MKKLYFLAAVSAAVLSLSSCNSDETNDIAASSHRAIEVSTYVHDTRVAGTDQAVVQTKGFTFWASQHTDLYDKTADKVDFLYAEAATYGGSSWSYDNLRFWPETDKLSFFAVAPSSELASNLSTSHGSGDVGAPIFSYTVPALSADQVDIVASKVTNRVNDGNPVQFIFDHMLTKLDFKAVKKAGVSADIDLQKVEIFYKDNAFIKNCLFDLNETTTSVPGTPEYFSNAGDVLAVELRNSVLAVPTSAGIIADDASKYLLAVPQNYAEGDIYAKVSYTVKVTDAALTSGSVDQVVVDQIINLPAVAGGLMQGKAYTYVLTLGAEGVSFNSEIKVSDWTVDQIDV